MRPPIMWIAIGFGAGLWVGLGLFGEGGSGKGDGFGPLVVLVAALMLARHAAVGAAFGIAMVAGMVWGAAALRLREGTCAGSWGRGKGEEGRVRAAVVRLADAAPQAGGIVDGRVVSGACGGTLRIRWPEGHAARGGTEWVVAGRWLGDAERGVLVARRVKLLDAEPRGRGALRGRLAERTAQLFGDRAPLVDALVIARTTELDPALRERYARSGLAHILSISGLHVGFVAAWLGLLLRRLSLGARSRFWSSTLIIAGYCWLLGFPAPATRAAVMLAVDGIARLRQRVAAPRGVIALAALVVLVIDPWAVRSVGAWLSVSAVGAVIWASRGTAKRHRVIRLVAPAIAATLITAPITALTFGTVAPIGVLANLIAIPLGAVAVPGLIIALGLSWVLPPLAALIAAGSGLALALLDVVAGATAAVPLGHVVMVAGWRAALTWAVVAAVAWWLWNSPRRSWLIAARLGFVVTVYLWTSLLDVSSLDACRCLRVTFLDVGQGDAVVLRTPTGRWILIDGGPRGKTGDAGRRVVVPFLRRQGATRVDLLVATHAHADHVGGLPAVLEAMNVGVVLEPGEPLGEAPYLEFLAATQAAGAAERGGTRWRAGRTGDRFELDGVRFLVLSPDSAWAAETFDPNEESVVLLVEYGNARLLFTGDAGLPVEHRLAGRVGDVDLLKVGHHGSRSATSEAWLDELRPEVAVISVAARNTYGHPAAEVVARLAAHGVRILRTDRDGTITFDTDGQRAPHIDVSHHD